MTTLTDEYAMRHDIIESWQGAHATWHKTGCGLTLLSEDMRATHYGDAHCEKCIEYKGHRNKQ